MSKPIPLGASYESPQYWMIVPAAGSGSRMRADKPKQYLTINHKTILEHTLERLLLLPGLFGVVVLVSPDDPFWSQLDIMRHPKIVVREGGKERSDSVLNGLTFLRDRVQQDDWILVHDAARPCVDLQDIENLVLTLQTHPVGGILGSPVADTIKYVDADGSIEQTLDRETLWRAYTPQMFRYGVLISSLQSALTAGETITDEASAVELAGYAPIMVEGRSDNIKVTRPEDLPLAALLLERQEHRSNGSADNRS